MKLKELLETFHQFIEKVGQAKMAVSCCNECKGEKTQEEHCQKHLDEALEIEKRLPNSLVWHMEFLQIEPAITLAIDGEGHITANLAEVEVS